MNIVNGFDIDTPEGAKKYLESEGIDVEQCIREGQEVIARIKAVVNECCCNGDEKRVLRNTQ